MHKFTIDEFDKLIKEYKILKITSWITLKQVKELNRLFDDGNKIGGDLQAINNKKNYNKVLEDRFCGLSKEEIEEFYTLNFKAFYMTQVELLRYVELQNKWVTSIRNALTYANTEIDTYIDFRIVQGSAHFKDKDVVVIEDTKIKDRDESI